MFLAFCLGEEEKVIKITKDFEQFLKERAHLMRIAMQKLVTGQRISAAEIIDGQIPAIPALELDDDTTKRVPDGSDTETSTDAN